MKLIKRDYDKISFALNGITFSATANINGVFNTLRAYAATNGFVIVGDSAQTVLEIEDVEGTGI